MGDGKHKARRDPRHEPMHQRTGSRLRAKHAMALAYATGSRGVHLFFLPAIRPDDKDSLGRPAGNESGAPSPVAPTSQGVGRLPSVTLADDEDPRRSARQLSGPSHPSRLSLPYKAPMTRHGRSVHRPLARRRPFQEPIPLPESPDQGSLGSRAPRRPSKLVPEPVGLNQAFSGSPLPNSRTQDMASITR